MDPAHLATFARQQGHADAHLTRARTLLERAIRQRWADGMINRDPDGAFSASLGPQEIELLMRPPSARTESVEDFRYDKTSAIGELVAKLDLMPTEADLLAVLLACETDPASSRLAGYLGGTQGAATLTVDTLFEIAYRPRVLRLGDAASLLHADLAPEGPARRLRFLTVDGADTRPFLAQSVRLHPRLTAWLLGRRELAGELVSQARLIQPSPPLGECDEKLVRQTIQAFSQSNRLVVIEGSVGAGRGLLLETAAYRMDRPLLVVGGRGLDTDRLIASFREATLQGALLAFRDADDALAEDREARFRDCLQAYAGPVALIGLSEKMASVTSLRMTTTITIPVPEQAERLALWKHYVGENTALTDVQWREVSGLYNLGIGGVVQVAAIARDMSRVESTPVGRPHLARAIRQLYDTDLATVAKRIDVTQTWDDVVLPDEVVDSIVGIVDRVAFRNEVLGEWGFGRKVGRGLGLTILFSGQPGTGKSMVAGLIARELGLDLYVIDLSRIMSKWLGETEKNLARAFDAAEAGHVLLLFDEADTLLGRRTSQISSSNDRHANLETNFILARLEQFKGIAAFTTNIASAIDPAIMRRMSANITFPFPDLEARTQLWQRMIPKEAPTVGRIDFPKLARDYELSGGFIKNVVLRAAFLAAREGSAIGMTHLERAARGEYGDRGALTSGGRLV